VTLDPTQPSPKKFSFVFALTFTALLLPGLIAGCGHNTSDTKQFPRVLLIGVDGMDPVITRSLMAQGKLPNFERLAKQGGFTTIQTTNPAQSPVAWSTISTGANPGEHGMFDFIWRHEENYLPDLSLADLHPSDKKIKIFGLEIPLGKPVYKSHRGGTPVWILTSQAEIPTVVLRYPVTFPPDKVHGKMISGMGVPDIRGTQGTFSFYTSEKTDNTRPQGGIIIPVTDTDTIDTKLVGPRGPQGDISIPLAISVDRADHSAEIVIHGEHIQLQEGSWGKWIRVKFPIDAFTHIDAICRFYLKSAANPFELYCSPMNFDPRHPLFPISYTDDYAKKLANAIGDFHTLGMPHDTWALNEGRMSEEMFLSQTDKIIAEEKAMLMHELQDYRSGLLMIVFETIDRISHMFWRYTDKESPLYDEEGAKKFGHVIEHYYEDMDATLGEILKYVDDKTLLIVNSDHGFTNFRRAVHLNSILKANGFQNFKTDAAEGRALLQDVDWSKTQAYAVGLGSIYINLKGRESRGSVEPGDEKRRIEQEIIDRLEKLTDPKDGAPVIHKVYRREEIYSGSQFEKMPDLVVAFNKGYRASWQTALGAAPPELMEDNMKKWSGDHIVEPSFVPGVLFSNRHLDPDKKITLYDIAPTILKEFGITPPSDYLGHPIFDDQTSTASSN